MHFTPGWKEGPVEAVCRPVQAFEWEKISGAKISGGALKAHTEKMS